MKYIKTLVLSTILTMMCINATFAQTSIKLIVPSPGGGVFDIIGRMLAEKLPMVIINRPGPGAIAATDLVVKSTPDGTTLLLGTTTNLSVNQYYIKSLPYNAETDLVPIISLGETASVFVVSSTIPADNIMQFLALAKSNPGKYSYGTSAFGNAPHLLGDILFAIEGINIVYVPYNGSPQGIADTIANRNTLFIDGYGTTKPHIDSGKLKLLGAAGNYKPAPNTMLLKDMRKDFIFSTRLTIMAPAKTPQQTVELLNKQFNEIFKDEDLIKRLRLINLIVTGGTAQHAQALLNEDSELWKKYSKFSSVQIK